MDPRIAQTMAAHDMTVLTDEERAERIRAIEAGEVPDPRSYDRALDRHLTRDRVPVRMAGGWSFSSLAKLLDED